jgi:hypothetical protein
MHSFPQDVIDAVLRHMNADHPDDSLAIVRGNGAPEATSAKMTGIDGGAGIWLVTEQGSDREMRISWSAPISERADIRREIVRLHTAALSRWPLSGGQNTEQLGSYL